jgi:hypothetical protein
MAIKTGDTLEYIADKLGVPAALRTSQAERKQMAEQMAQMAAMAQQQAAPAGAEGAPMEMAQ